ncbi:hypothetical protein KFE25_013720 [Diacronema lutheri]|uniref:Xaa-Pro dipeptidyl-peptidase C-terminal domain-containing protein n=1 Tax=Diacronema lutheri TaxID=2081491 RepID=A0A8J6CBE6_DIALT|nr:hypothetical protein KFE25_013720 [Diacronema lutheri]
MARPTVTSVAVPMRDGTRLAVDVTLPSAVGSFPVALNQTRYWRSYWVRGQDPRARALPISTHHPSVQQLLDAGFAVVCADVRGTGASHGTWQIPFSSAEASDAHDLVAWAERQPWSTGAVVSAGLSYEGTTSVLAGSCGRAAMRGAVARGFEWDLYADIVAPGGMLNRGFLKDWSESVLALDRGRVPQLFGFGTALFVRGVRPLDEDPRGEALERLVRARVVAGLADIWASALALSSADEPFGRSGESLAAISLCARPALRSASACAPLQVWASWFDGASARAALRMWEHVPALCEVVIGAWSHTGDDGCSFGRRGAPDPPLAQQVEMQLAFLRECVASNGARTRPRPRRVRYFMMAPREPRGGSWRETEQWPPARVAPSTLALRADGALDGALASARGDLGASLPPASADEQWRRWTPDARATTGRANRWHTQNAKPVALDGRARAARRMLVWTGVALRSALTVVGEPVLRLRLVASYARAPVFAYLELVDPSGGVWYAAEAIGVAAQDAGAPCELVLAFLPTAFTAPVGWRLQLGLAAADADTFPTNVPARSEWRVDCGLHGGVACAALALPVAL